MSEGELILDYASPRPRGKVRLPSKSYLTIEHDRDTTTVTESLRGKTSAVVAMIFAAFVMGVLLLVIVGLLTAYQRNPQDNLLVEAIVLIVLELIEGSVGVVVLDQTYRKTVVRVRDGEMTLIFSALLTRTRWHHWPIDEVGTLNVQSTQSGAGLPTLAELRIQPARDVSVHLFTDHREVDVLHIAALLRAALAGETISMPPQAVSTVPDAATFDRLMQTHRTLREIDRSKRID